MNTKKKFLNLPEYPGGKSEFRKYIKENLKYPDEALKNKIEGIVFVSAEINDNGDVVSAQVRSGIGYGCDEEALRLIEGLQFGGVKNRGLRVKTKKQFRIQFKLPVTQKPKSESTTIKYSIKPEKQEVKKVPEKVSYSYTINLKKN